MKHRYLLVDVTWNVAQTQFNIVHHGMDFKMKKKGMDWRFLCDYDGIQSFWSATVEKIRNSTAHSLNKIFDPVSMPCIKGDFDVEAPADYKYDHQLSSTSVAVYKISYNRIISSILKHAI